MRETWKDIEGYEGLYQASSTGKIRSFRKSNIYHGQVHHELKPTVLNNGYCVVTLYRSPKDRKRFLVHTLIAKTFLQNPNNYPCVNHKDENKQNNDISNLEWCTYSYNNSYGTARIRARKSRSKIVHQYTLDGVWVATYFSATMPAKIFGISPSCIHDCCKKKTDCSGGYKWSY
jgi:hypothetical protein